MHDRLYFRQLLSGRDFATNDMAARQMVNFVYLIGDRESGETLIVDPAYAVSELIDIAAADGMEIVGALGTHYHADHVGGAFPGMPRVQGISDLLEARQVPIHVQADEVPWVTRSTGVEASDLVAHKPGDVVRVGELEVELIHTPGHTPGSQCFLVDNLLVSGDTLFLDGCGRTDLPGGDPEQLYFSLTQALAKVPDEAILYPGHMYSQAPSQSVGETRRFNFVFQPKSAEQWMTMFG